MPEAIGADFSGNPVSILHNGNAKMLLFLAHWCGGSQREVPKVQGWLEGNELPDNVELISVVTFSYPPNTFPERPDPESNWPPSDWLASEDWTVPVVVDHPYRYSIHRKFGEGGFPYWVMVGPAGTVVARVEGADLVDVGEWANKLSAM
jgi:hypothetical protein